MAYETDVLIIGAGPTGSTTALALANCGVSCHIVSRGNWMAVARARTSPTNVPTRSSAILESRRTLRDTRARGS